MKTLVKSLPMALFGLVLIALIVLSMVPGAQAKDAQQQDCSPQYTVQRGEWLASIARRCGVTLQAVLDANTDLPNPNLVFPGQVINLPVEGQAAAGGDQTLSQGDPTDQQSQLEFGPPDQDESLGSAPADQTGQSNLTGGQSYTIQPGDTLLDLADRFDVSLEDLILANPDLLQAGGTLMLPAGAEQGISNQPGQQNPNQTSTPPAVGDGTQATAPAGGDGQATAPASGQIGAQPTEQFPDLPVQGTPEPNFGEMQP